MKPSIVITNLVLLALALLATDFVFALPAHEIRSPHTGGIPEGYTLDQLRVTGEVNGVAVNHTGTVQEIYAQLDAEDNSFKLSNLTATVDQNSGINQLKKRFMTDINCLPVAGQTWNGADVPAIDDGIAFLQNSGFMCNVGPHSCGRVSCSWAGAIYICNNGDNEIRPSCDTVGTYVRALVDKCTHKRGIFWHDTIGGQVWDIDNWNVIVRRDGC
ncbi:hypothetical protein BKA65DRAFT_548066 [Rhexocercosporidium sp. MPI-PUGE-AT-0058]|nr:hypothetical protein BKA65DRAFT_548066 [Rhexocercosporidium sp. MPI-PUGE-AT-0058]